MFLKNLTEKAGVSGNEKEVRDYIISEIKDFVDDIYTDRIGNLIVFKKGKNKGTKRIMITAHMDEVGLMVKEIDSAGLIKFIPVGGIDPRVLVSKTVQVGKDKIIGVIGAKPIHLQKKNEWSKVLGIDELYVDIGAKDKEDAEKKVSVGDYISFYTLYEEIGDNMIKAKALDNRVGCSILMELIKSDVDVDFYGVFTVMEEVGLIGAGPAAFKVEPDIAVILEGTVCYEMPDLESHLIPTKVGEGPAISLADRTTIYDKKLRERVVEVAKKNDIKWQYRKTAMGGNDSGKIHTTKSGCSTVTLSVPTRYIHSPVSIISKSDYKSTYDLLNAILPEIDKEAK